MSPETDFAMWARELAQTTEETPMPRRRVDITVTISWVIVLTLTALMLVGAWVIGTHIISWIVGG